MRQLKILGAALVAIFALGITATSALAILPDLHCLKSEEPGTTKCPVHLHFADNGVTKTELQSTAGGKLEGKGVSILLLTTELSSLGTFGAIFLAVEWKKESTKCNTKGDAAGAVVTKGAFHVVYWSLSPLRVGIAFLPEEVTIECGVNKTIKVEGCALSTAEPKKPFESELDVTNIDGALEGSGGKNALTAFDNQNGTGTVPCKLESKFVGGALAQSMETIPTVLLETLPGANGKPQMITVLNE
jgi:hypothetical protein